MDHLALFQFGDFSLASGRRSLFKIECDAISPEEWHSLGRIARPILPAYGTVVAVPRGGNAWAEIFQHYVTPGARRVLFVDDVYTTGSSMYNTVYNYNLALNNYVLGPMTTVEWHGVVLFARGPVPAHVTALFHLNEQLQ